MFLSHSFQGISEEIGIIKRLYFPLRQMEYPFFHTCVMEGGNMSFLLRAPLNYTITAGGYARNKQEAFLGLMGETLERYGSAFPNPDTLLRDTYNGLLKKHISAIAPEKIALFHEAQYKQKGFPYAPFHADTYTDWTPMNDLLRGGIAYYPASLVYMPYLLSHAEDIPITSSQSTGLAAHTCPSKALLLALYEVIERDAFAISWHAQLPLPKIHLDSRIRALIREIFPYPYEIHLLDMTLDSCVPSILGLLWAKNAQGEFMVCAAATRENYLNAITKTLQELAQGIPYATYLSEKYANWTPQPDYSNVGDFDTHAALYHKIPALWENNPISTWRNTPESLSLPETEKTYPHPEAIIHSILSHLQSEGYEVLAKELSTPDSEQLGFRIFRVQIPQYIPLGAEHPHYYLGGQRLYEIPEKLGYPSYPFPKLNTNPHPFP